MAIIPPNPWVTEPSPFSPSPTTGSTALAADRHWSDPLFWKRQGQARTFLRLTIACCNHSNSMIK